ncbi:hypothetical protein HDU86_000494 [Geranomyces michiganensis]|nr:hypothetical protein HDU86_000494 [Geranomyces michiganensis]
MAISKDIREHNPLWKVIAVKFIVFTTFWGTIVLDLLVKLNVIKSTSYYSAKAASDMISAFMEFRRADADADADAGYDDNGGSGGSLPRMRFGAALVDALSPVVFWRDVKSAPDERKERQQRWEGCRGDDKHVPPPTLSPPHMRCNEDCKDDDAWSSSGSEYSSS